MQEQQSHPHFLLSSMYSCWQHHQIPAPFYHYLLAILPNLQQSQQVLLMAREVKSLKANTHPYHRILNAIEARQKSLQIIRNTAHVLLECLTYKQGEWSKSGQGHVVLQFENCSRKLPTNLNEPSRYTVVYEDPTWPILTPPAQSKSRQKSLQELVNHIQFYQRITVQIVMMISCWEEDLKDLGYKHSVIQFQYQDEDYLEVISKDASELLNKYQMIFENNPFLLVRKVHQGTELASIYNQLMLSQQMTLKVNYCLNAIATHEAEILRARMLDKVKQASSKRRTISKPTEVGRIYMNYNHGQPYILVRDSEAIRKQKIVATPYRQNRFNFHSSASKCQAPNIRRPIKNQIVINPETRLMTIDRTVRKHPVKSDLFNLPNKLQSSKQLLQHGPQAKPNSKLKSSRAQELFKPTDSNTIASHQSLHSTARSEISLRERVQVKTFHGQNTVVVAARTYNNRDDQIDRNRGLSTLRTLEVLSKFNCELKLKNKSYAQQQELSRVQESMMPALEHMRHRQAQIGTRGDHFNPQTSP